MLSLPLQDDGRDTEPLLGAPTPYRYDPLDSGDPVLVLDTTSGKWEPGRIQERSNQPHAYVVEFHSGRVAQRNRVHLKLDKTRPTAQNRTPSVVPLPPAPVPTPITVPVATPVATVPDTDSYLLAETDDNDFAEPAPPVPVPVRTQDVPLRRSQRSARPPSRYLD
jgi:hypothetical protein